jgi:hypothetical protein
VLSGPARAETILRVSQPVGFTCGYSRYCHPGNRCPAFERWPSDKKCRPQHRVCATHFSADFRLRVYRPRLPLQTKAIFSAAMGANKQIRKKIAVTAA